MKPDHVSTLRLVGACLAYLAGCYTGDGAVSDASDAGDDSGEATDADASTDAGTQGDTGDGGTDSGEVMDADGSPFLNREDLIAHALGGLHDESQGDLIYTNTLEALERNYDLGRRVFEVDLFFTSDDHLVGYHGGHGNPAAIGGVLPGDLTLEEFLELDYLATYTVVSLEMLLEFMAADFTDIALVCDFKEFGRFEESIHYVVDLPISQESSVLDRVIPEIYHQNQYDVAMAIYPFREVMYTLYKESTDLDLDSILEFAREKRITAVVATLQWANDILPPSMFTDLADIDVPTFVATVNDPEEIERYRDLGVYGFFTDFYVPE